jgi:hypothetical protein
MKKLALFVEGQTEQIFAHKLIEEIAGKKNLSVQLDSLSGGATIDRTISGLKLFNAEEETKYFVLIRDSGSDSRVASDVRDNAINLKNNGYNMIIGLRDLFPLHIDKLDRLHKTTNRAVHSDEILCKIIIAVREIETWFLSDQTHFEKIHSDLNISKITSELGIDLSKIDMESIEFPSQTLHQIYQLVGRAYNKSKKHVDRTVDALDYEHIYLQIKNSLHSLSQFIDSIDDFLTDATTSS